MTYGEASKLIMVITAAYPEHYKGMDAERVSALISLWSALLEDYPYAVVSAALRAFMASDTKGFPPVPGQIIDRIVKMTRPVQMAPMEAWALVRRAARNSIYNSEEEFAKLPEDVQKVVGSPVNLASMATMSPEAMSVQESHFIRQYEAEQKRRVEDAKMPQAVRDLLTSGKVLRIGDAS